MKSSEQEARQLQMLQARVVARVRLEIPPREQIDAQIEAVIGRFRLVRDRAQSSALVPFDPSSVPTPDERQLQIDKDPSAASFFSHGIGGHMTAVSVHMYTYTVQGIEYDPVLFDTAQQIVHGKVERYRSWQFTKIPYEKRAVEPFSKAAFSFRWSHDPDLFRELDSARSDLVTQINYINGMIPTGRLMEIIEEEQNAS